MTETEIIDITKESIFVLIKMVGPLLMIAMFVGLLIGLFQALTQIQEMTLTFVPKIIAVFISLIFLMPFMISQMTVFAQNMYDKIISLG
ncbi:MAG: flagellar biosynthesis protein FliQ [Alphaproteobacteria bacterium]